MPLLSASEWSAFLRNFPDAHLLQTTAWGELKSAFGWEVVRVASEKGSPAAGAQILFRPLPLGLSLAYIPKGPLPSNPDAESPGLVEHPWGALRPEIDLVCRSRRAVFLKVELDKLDTSPTDQATLPGFRRSAHTIQPRRTLIVDLRGEEQELLARMKQKTRYNVRLAIKRGVIVQPSPDIDLFFRMMRETGERERFGVHSLAYYQRAYDLFHPRGECELLLAEYEQTPLAALMVFAHGRRAWYFYGASVDTYREFMPTYLLQWEAIRWARALGCTDYDFWGVPDTDEETLESQFTGRSDGLWGVYRFKRGFGGQLRRAPDPWDLVYQPFFYRLYLWWTGRSKEVKG
ncbi:MAG TPA: peptidoglycan bridge formation glycyltransferase FemA/FemB family protein [Anaerolineales bacterium]